jgi:glucose-6-phosphate isomerase
MSVRFNGDYLGGFIGEHEYPSAQPAVTAADAVLCGRRGAGSDFLGWVRLPQDYDRDEFRRIKRRRKRYRAIHRCSSS